MTTEIRSFNTKSIMRFYNHPMLAFALVFCFLVVEVGRSQEPQASKFVEEIRAALNEIDPYLPGVEICAEIDLFGSSSMDTMAHGWAIAFKEFQ